MIKITVISYRPNDFVDGLGDTNSDFNLIDFVYLNYTLYDKILNEIAVYIKSFIHNNPLTKPNQIKTISIK